MFVYGFQKVHIRNFKFGRGKTNKKREATKSEGRGLEEELDARSCARSGRKDVVGEVKGIEMMAGGEGEDVVGATVG